MFSRIKLLLELSWKSKGNRWYLLTFLLFIPMFLVGLLSILLNPLFPSVLLYSGIPLFCIMTPVLVFIAIHFTLRSASNIMLNWFGADKNDAYEIILNHVLGVNQPKVAAKDGKVDLDDYTKARLTAGLPAVLTVNADTAVLTEFNGRPFRAYCKAGKYNLLPFEKISYTVKLRDQFVSHPNMKAITRDGIGVSFKGGIGFHIRRSPGASLLEDPYPVDDDTIFRVAYKRPVGAAGGMPPAPSKTVPFLVWSQLRNVVSKYRFSQLIELSLEGQESIPLNKLAAEVADLARGIADTQGITISFVGLEWELDELEPAVREQIRKNWRRTRDQQVNSALSEDEAILIAKRIETVLNTLKDNDYLRDEELPKIRDMINDAVFIKHDVYDLIGEEDNALAGSLIRRRGRIANSEGSMTPQEEEAFDKRLSDKFPELATTEDDREEGGKAFP